MLADQGTREMTFSAGNMLVNKTLLTPGSVPLKISYMEPKKIDEYVLVRLTDEITKKLYVPGHGIGAYNLMPLLAEVVMRLNLLEGKEPGALPHSLTRP
jgi:hypothetical protein